MGTPNVCDGVLAPLPELTAEDVEPRFALNEGRLEIILCSLPSEIVEDPLSGRSCSPLSSA